MSSSSKAREAEERAYEAQKKAEEVRKQAMEVNAQRQQMQNLRNTQLQRSMALTSATAQGAQFGTGLQGGYGQISGQSTDNAVGINTNLQFGEDIFKYNAEASRWKQQASGYQSESAMWGSISGLGGNIAKSANTFNNLTSGIFGGGSDRGIDLWGPDFTRTGTYYGK